MSRAERKTDIVFNTMCYDVDKFGMLCDTGKIIFLFVCGDSCVYMYDRQNYDVIVFDIWNESLLWNKSLILSVILSTILGLVAV